MTTQTDAEAALSTLEFDSDAGELRKRDTGEIAELKKCPGCGEAFPAGGRGLGKAFCSDKCRTGFHARAKAEGGPMVALVKAWTMTRHAKPGTREAEICRYARSELTAIASAFNERDEAEGRSAVDYVATLMDAGTIWTDRLKI